MLRRTVLASAAAAASSLVLSACGGNDDDPSVVAVAQQDARFSILVEAIVAAGLVDTLEGAGPFTVFAPTNEAFARLLAELGLSKEQLLADRALLTSVLTTHVVGARVGRADVSPGRAVTPLQGGFFKIDASGSALVVTDGRNRTANIVATDLAARNGVVHAIDRVLLPANRNLVQTAQALPDFSLLVEAVVAANLAGTLSGPGPFTVFAPTNAAFASLLAELGTSKEALFANRPLLTAVLTYHVLPARVLRADVPVGPPIATVQGQTFTVGPDLRITDSRGRRPAIVTTDVLTANGVIHAIDRVLLPRT